MLELNVALVFGCWVRLSLEQTIIGTFFLKEILPFFLPQEESSVFCLKFSSFSQTQAKFAKKCKKKLTEDRHRFFIKLAKNLAGSYQQWTAEENNSRLQGHFLVCCPCS
jgi:hypothetical protein